MGITREERSLLEGVSLEQLREEAARYALDMQGDREALFERILTYLERHGPSTDFVWSQPHNSPCMETPGLFNAEQLPEEDGAPRGELPMGANTSRMDSLARLCEVLTLKMQQDNMMMQQIMRAIGELQGGCPTEQGPLAGMPPRVAPAAFTSNTPPPRDYTRRSTIAPGQAVTLLASQLPNFDGTENEIS